MKRYTITQFRKDYPDDDACLDKIFKLRFTNLVCPKCENDKPFTRVKDRRSYQCPCCGFQLYPTKNTVFEKTTKPLIYWFYAIYLQTTTRNGVSAKELQRQMQMSYTTALRMAHQIKKLMTGGNADLFTGVISMDETFIGGLNKNRHWDKKAENNQGRSVKDKTPVFSMHTTSGKVKAFVIADTSAWTIKPIIDANVQKDYCVLVTDEWKAYKPLEADNYKHVAINHSTGEYVRGAFHTNRAESFNAILKRTIKGTHIHVSDKYLQLYVNEVAFRWDHKKRQDIMFDLALQNVVLQPS